MSKNDVNVYTQETLLYQSTCMLENKAACRCQPISWGMAAILQDSTIVIVVLVVHMCLQAIPPAIITMRKSIHGFPLLPYMYMGMVLHLAALLLVRALLILKNLLGKLFNK